VPENEVRPEDLEDVRSSYDRVAQSYVAMGIGDLESTPWLRAPLAAFAEDVTGLGPVLDVGCGPGAVTAHLTGLGLEVSGVDLSPRMVDHARRLHPGLRFAVASATDLDVGGASLGGILGWWSLFHLSRSVLPGVLASFPRALVPGGQLLLGTDVGDGEVVAAADDQISWPLIDETRADARFVEERAVLDGAHTSGDAVPDALRPVRVDDGRQPVVLGRRDDRRQLRGAVLRLVGQEPRGDDPARRHDLDDVALPLGAFGDRGRQLLDGVGLPAEEPAVALPARQGWSRGQQLRTRRRIAAVAVTEHEAAEPRWQRCRHRSGQLSRWSIVPLRS
jgi:SAM-dependent methyltransferase